MADTKQRQDATATAAEGIPTPPTAIPGIDPNNPGAQAVTFDDFMAGLEGGEPEAPKTESGSETKDTPKEEGKEKEDGETAEQSAETPETDADPEDAEEEEALAKANDEKLPKWVSKRLFDDGERKRQLRAERDAEKSAREAAETALAEIGTGIKAPLAPSPLAHLDTPEKLDAEHEAVLRFLDDCEERPDETLQRFTDDAQFTAEQKLLNTKAWCRQFLKHQKAHADVLARKQSTLEEVKKTHPALFDLRTEEGKQRAALYAADPRTLPDWEQFIADAMRGRRERLAASAGKGKSPRGEPAAAKANGKTNGKVPPVYTPPVAAARAPITPTTATDARSGVLTKAGQRGGVSMDEMLDAGVF